MIWRLARSVVTLESPLMTAYLEGLADHSGSPSQKDKAQEMNLANSTSLAEQLDSSTREISQSPHSGPVDLAGITSVRSQGLGHVRESGSPALGTDKVASLGATSHESGQSQAGGNGDTGKVFDGTRLCGGDESDGSVKSSETSETSGDEEQETGDVEGKSHTEGVREGGRGNTEGDLHGEMTFDQTPLLISNSLRIYSRDPQDCPTPDRASFHLPSSSQLGRREHRTRIQE